MQIILQYLAHKFVIDVAEMSVSIRPSTRCLFAIARYSWTGGYTVSKSTETRLPCYMKLNVDSRQGDAYRDERFNFKVI